MLCTISDSPTQGMACHGKTKTWTYTMRIDQRPEKAVPGKMANTIEDNPVYWRLFCLTSLIRSLLLIAIRSLHFSSSRFSPVSPYPQSITFYSVSDASARFRICDSHLSDCSVVASPNLCMPLAFPHSLGTSDLILFLLPYVSEAPLSYP